jgi:hypothetical protein
LRCIRAILQLFADASGLVTNMDKCSISPIRCSEEEVAAVLDAFPGPPAPFPCKYLGIPLTLLKPRRANEQPLIDKVAARIPTWKAGLLNDAGRATLTKVTLSAIPVHVSIASGLSAWALRQIDKRHHAFLWAGTEDVAGRKCRVAWRTVNAPTCYGGLCVFDLKLTGFALRLRWEWQHRVRLDLGWCSLPRWKERKVQCMFQSSITVVVGDGWSTRV